MLLSLRHNLVPQKLKSPPRSRGTSLLDFLLPDIQIQEGDSETSTHRHPSARRTQYFVRDLVSVVCDSVKEITLFKP